MTVDVGSIADAPNAYMALPMPTEIFSMRKTRLIFRVRILVPLDVIPARACSSPDISLCPDNEGRRASLTDDFVTHCEILISSLTHIDAIGMNRRVSYPYLTPIGNALSI